MHGQSPVLHGFEGPQVSLSRYEGHHASALCCVLAHQLIYRDESNIGKQFIEAAQGGESSDAPLLEDVHDFQTGSGGELAVHNGTLDLLTALDIKVSRWADWASPTTGRRQDAAHAYVHPVVASQTNLHLVTEHRTIRVLLEDGKASGVEYCFNPLARGAVDSLQPPVAHLTMRARKMVVVCAGALASPGILERSGIGAKDVLKNVGIPVTVEWVPPFLTTAHPANATRSQVAGRWLNVSRPHHQQCYLQGLRRGRHAR